MKIQGFFVLFLVTTKYCKYSLFYFAFLFMIFIFKIYFYIQKEVVNSTLVNFMKAVKENVKKRMNDFETLHANV